MSSFRPRCRRATAAAALLLALPTCGKDPIAPDDRLELRAESAHFLYFAAPGDEPVDTAYQERHLAWASARLALVPRQMLLYHKYRDRAHLQLVTGHDPTNGFAEPGTYSFHSIWPIDNHEYIHALFTSEVGEPPPLFNEGVAVAHHGASVRGSFDGDPLWNGRSVHDIALERATAGTLPDVARLAYWRNFYEYDGELTYPVAGSFVAFLIEAEGVGTFKVFVRAVGDPLQDLERTRQQFFDAYGITLDVARDRWLEFLEARS